ncbi:MAG: hypothetical protein ACRDGI_11430 [Candidatus Limnocylindrales bacterium]
MLVAAITVWVGWGVFIYRPTPNALPACVPGAPLDCSTVDGFPIGTMSEICPCSDAGDHEQVALDGLAARDGSHATVTRSMLFALDMSRFCGPVICSISGYSIFVFEFADGSRHAIGVDCPGIEPTCRAVQTYTSSSGA